MNIFLKEFVSNNVSNNDSNRLNKTSVTTLRIFNNFSKDKSFLNLN